KVTGSGGVIPGNYTVTNTQMADYATLNGARRDSRRTEISGSKLSEFLGASVESEELRTGSGVANGSTALADIINSEGENAFGFTAEKTEVKFTLNGKSVMLSATDTLDDAVNKINLETDVNATLNGGKISFAGKNINFTSVDGTVVGEKGAFGIKEGAQPRTLTFDTSASLNSIAAAGGPDFLGGGSSVSFSINGHSFSFSGSDSLDDIINTVNTSGAGVSMSLDKTTGALTARSTASGESISFQNGSGNFGNVTGMTDKTVTSATAISTDDSIAKAAAKMGINLQTSANGKFEFKINGKEFSFDTTTTISGMMDKINSSGVGVKMHYSELTDSFKFTSAEMGSSSKVEIEDMGGSNAVSGFFGLTSTSATGTDASITINGETITKSSNTFSIDGMSFELTGNYQATGSDTGYGVTFTHDTQKTIDKVKAFIEDYNKLVKDLYDKTREEKFYKYSPLTDEERDELTEKEAEEWDKKAKSGILRSDSAIMNFLSNLRSAAYSIVGETGTMAADIGITTSGKTGELKLDEEKFARALTENPNRVAQVMTGTSTATDRTQKYAESGFATRIYDTMNNYRQNTRAVQIQEQTKRVYEYEIKIKDIEAKLYIKEEALWRQYSSLETLMSGMNSQQNWLSAQLSAL
ncbi:MAG: flagellar filament capping protein FliD, partial [Clostridia bacterium]|nr:flagellar filament capping protein FliD [Clostridia bacterium]